MERKFYINWQGIVEEAKYRRKRQRITQQHLALLAQVSTPTISRFESGREDIEVSSVLSILHALGMTDKRTLIFTEHKEKYDPDRHIILFKGMDGDKEINCAISGEALVDHFKGATILQRFNKNRSEIEHLSRRKYLYDELEPDGSILIRTGDLL
jgi:transcriptional regulator with XRE-family HTH domain